MDAPGIGKTEALFRHLPWWRRWLHSLHLPGSGIVTLKSSTCEPADARGYLYPADIVEFDIDDWVAWAKKNNDETTNPFAWSRGPKEY